MMNRNTSVFILFFMVLMNTYQADQVSKTHYLGNEGIMIVSGESKVLFDPFFHNHYSHYTLVPEPIREAIFSNQAPYDDISALFISHAHGDHFDKEDVMKYLSLNKKVQLIASSQVIEQLQELKGFNDIRSRITAINLEKGDKPYHIKVANIEVEAVRIPHSGWPKRANISNLVFRIKLHKGQVFMHMGDADVNTSHYDQQNAFWSNKKTQVAYPPYWFSLSKEGRSIQESLINADKTIGVHVPTKVPSSLKSTGDDYFSKPGETREHSSNPANQ